MSKTLLVMLLALVLMAPGVLAEGSQEGGGEESVELDLWIPGSGEDGEAYEARSEFQMRRSLSARFRGRNTSRF